MRDQISISGLEVKARLGITEEERAQAQRITVDLVCIPRRGFGEADDRIENTADYAVMCNRVEAVAFDHPRNLLETLAQDIATTLLTEFPLAAVEVEVRKYILPKTDYVSVRIRRPEHRE